MNSALESVNRENLGGWSIEYQLFEDINKLRAPDSGILEFGSGYGTIELCKLGPVFSIENDASWLNTAPSHYIHAPLTKRKSINPKFPKHRTYYSNDVITKELPLIKGNYGLVLVDGPTGAVGRSGLLEYLDILDTSVPYIFDDVNRNDELVLANEFSRLTSKTLTIKDGSSKKYAIVI